MGEGDAPADGRRVIDHEWVQTRWPVCTPSVEAFKLANWRVASALNEGELNPADASAMKVLGTEQQCQCAARADGGRRGVGPLRGDAPARCCTVSSSRSTATRPSARSAGE